MSNEIININDKNIRSIDKHFIDDTLRVFKFNFERSYDAYVLKSAKNDFDSYICVSKDQKDAMLKLLSRDEINYNKNNKNTDNYHRFATYSIEGLCDGKEYISTLMKHRNRKFPNDFKPTYTTRRCHSYHKDWLFVLKQFDEHVVTLDRARTKNMLPNLITLYELIRSDKPCKPYLDIDRHVEENQKDKINEIHLEFVSKLTEDLINIFKNKYNITINQHDIKISCAHRNDKLSYHVVISPKDKYIVYHTNVKKEMNSAHELSVFLKEKDQVTYKYVDDNVYSHDRNMRVLFSYKIKENKELVGQLLPCINGNIVHELDYKNRLDYLITDFSDKNREFVNLITKNYNIDVLEKKNEETKLCSTKKINDDNVTSKKKSHLDDQLLTNKIMHLIKSWHPSAKIDKSFVVDYGISMHCSYKDRTEICNNNIKHEHNNFYVNIDDKSGNVYGVCMSEKCKHQRINLGNINDLNKQHDEIKVNMKYLSYDEKLKEIRNFEISIDKFIETGGILLIKSPMGTGKTQFVANQILQLPINTNGDTMLSKLWITLITYRVTLAANLSGTFGKLGFKCYNNSVLEEKINSIRLLILQYDSFGKRFDDEGVLMGDNGVLIIDESESLLFHTIAETMDRDKSRDNMTILLSYIKNCKYVIILDADLGVKTMEFIGSIAKETNKTMHIIHNEYTEEIKPVNNLNVKFIETEPYDINNLRKCAKKMEKIWKKKDKKLKRKKHKSKNKHESTSDVDEEMSSKENTFLESDIEKTNLNNNNNTTSDSESDTNDSDSEENSNNSDDSDKKPKGKKYVFERKNNTNKKYIYVSSDLEKTLVNLIDDLSKGLRVIVMCSTVKMLKNLRKAIEELLPIFKKNDWIKTYYGKSSFTDKQNICDINNIWIHYRVIIYTSTIEAGVDFNIPNIFHRRYMFISPGGASARSLFQMAWRVRHFWDPDIYVYIPKHIKNIRNSYIPSIVYFRDKIIERGSRLTKINLINQNNVRKRDYVDYVITLEARNYRDAYINKFNFTNSFFTKALDLNFTLIDLDDEAVDIKDDHDFVSQLFKKYDNGNMGDNDQFIYKPKCDKFLLASDYHIYSKKECEEKIIDIMNNIKGGIYKERKKMK